MHQLTVEKTASGARSCFHYNGNLQSAEYERTLINHFTTFPLQQLQEVYWFNNKTKNGNQDSTARDKHNAVMQKWQHRASCEKLDAGRRNATYCSNKSIDAFTESLWWATRAGRSPENQPVATGGVPKSCCVQKILF